MEFTALFGARGMGWLTGLSPGRGLIGRPGLSKAGAVTLRGSMPCPSEMIARWRSIADGCDGSYCAFAASLAAVDLDTGKSSGVMLVSALGCDLLLLLLTLFDLLLASSSCRASTSRSRSSSSRVFLLPLVTCCWRALRGSSSYSESDSFANALEMSGWMARGDSSRGAGGALRVAFFAAAGAAVMTVKDGPAVFLGGAGNDCWGVLESSSSILGERGGVVVMPWLDICGRGFISFPLRVACAELLSDCGVAGSAAAAVVMTASCGVSDRLGPAGDGASEVSLTLRLAVLPSRMTG